jgi:ubiquinone/menaquinone biosynthesis C-methylase UbiE
MKKEDFSKVWKDGENTDGSGSKLDLKLHLLRQRTMPQWVQAKEQANERICSALSEKPDFVYLDIGCGLGLDLIEIAKKMKGKGKLIGLDFNSAMVTAASELVEEFKSTLSDSAVEIEVRKADIFSLKELFEADSVDVVRADITLQHLGTSAKILEACGLIQTVLKPGGSFVSLESASSQFYCTDPEITQIYDSVMPKTREGGPAVILKLYLRDFTVELTPIPFTLTAEMVVQQDPEWVKLKGMGRMLKEKKIMEESKVDHFIERYIELAQSNQMISISVLGLVVATKKNG